MKKVGVILACCLVGVSICVAVVFQQRVAKETYEEQWIEYNESESSELDVRDWEWETYEYIRDYNECIEAFRTAVVPKELQDLSVKYYGSIDAVIGGAILLCDELDVDTQQLRISNRSIKSSYNSFMYEAFETDEYLFDVFESMQGPIYMNVVKK